MWRHRSTPVVVTRLWGGLGNQLFQVAAGLAVGRRLGCPTVLDHSALDTDDHREFELAGWQLPVSFELPGWMTPIAAVPGAPGHGPMSGKPTVVTLEGSPRRHLLARTVAHVMEGPMGYQPELERVSAPCVLSGYWQAWKHVAPVRHLLRKAQLTLPMPAAIRAEADRLAATRAIAVHVRRTDFLGSNAAIFGGVSAEYVHEALALARNRLGPRPVRVFSDDLAWCWEHLADIPDVMIPMFAGTSNEDLFLMASCGAHVIANSTFSWWGATLADTDLVIAPATWYNNPTLRDDDLVPPDWVQLPVDLRRD